MKTVSVVLLVIVSFHGSVMSSAAKKDIKKLDLTATHRRPLLTAQRTARAILTRKTLKDDLNRTRHALRETQHEKQRALTERRTRDKKDKPLLRKRTRTEMFGVRHETTFALPRYMKKYYRLAAMLAARRESRK